MRKIAFISFILFVLTGCAALRKSPAEYKGNGIVSSGAVVAESKRLNITNTGFYVQKAEITIKTEEGEDNFLGTVKYEPPDKFLVSLRSRTGIEGARVLLTGDSVFINDRINRIYYYGTEQAVKRNYGVNAVLMPVVFGDLIGTIIYSDTLNGCDDGTSEVISVVNGQKINYMIDCRLLKAIEAYPDNSLNMPGVKLNFGSFYSKGQYIVPGEISVIDARRKSTVTVRIASIEIPWTGRVEFIRGENYDIQRLP